MQQSGENPFVKFGVASHVWSGPPSYELLSPAALWPVTSVTPPGNRRQFHRQAFEQDSL